MHHLQQIAPKACCSEHSELLATVRTFLSAVPDDYWWYALGSLFLLSLLILLKAKWVSRRKPTMTWKRKKLLTDQQVHTVNNLFYIFSVKN